MGRSTNLCLLWPNLGGFVLLHLAIAIWGQGALDWFGMRSAWPWPWTLLTYMVTQGSLRELFFNLLWLWGFSEIFMMVGTRQRMLASYIGGGLMGALTYLLAANLGLAPGGILLGASASICALAVTAAMLAPSYGVHLLILGRVTLKTIAWITLAFAVLLPLLMGNISGAWAHAGGALGGYLVAIAMRRGWLPRFSVRKFRRPNPKKEPTLDDLLDKVRRSGYNSLTLSEKRKLIEYSNKL